MWTKLQLQNFRGYADTGIQELRGLTILIGPNGGGKSTILKLLMAFKQTAESFDNTTTLITSVDTDKTGYVDLGLYQDYVFQGDVQKEISIYLSWQPPIRKGNQISFPLAEQVQSLEIQLAYRQTGKQVVVQKLTYYGAADSQTGNKKSKGNILISLSRQARGAYKLHIPPQHEDKWKTKGNDISKNYEPQKFYRFSPELLANAPSIDEARLRSYVQDFENQLFVTYYLGPLREHPLRYYEATGERPVDLGIKGQKIGPVLYADSADQDGKIIPQTNEWLQKLDIAHSLKLSRIAKGNLFHLSVQGINQIREVNIADYGFGVSQILPVIAESLYAPNGSTLLIEQPEIHLNAHQQLRLPDFFTELMQTTGKQFIIETHSEYFLKRLGTLVASRKLHAADVIIFYCDSDASGSHMRPIYLDELGQMSWWPEGFLSEGFEGAAEHIEAMELYYEDGGREG